MREFKANQVYDYPWDYLTAANWRKYPNEISTHVVAVDTLNRKYDHEKQILTSERLITCRQPIPSWLKPFVGNNDISYVREVSVVDMQQKTLTMRSVNLTLTQLLRVYEVVKYEPGTDSSITQFTQTAEFKSNMGFLLSNRIEDWAVERFHANAFKGKLGFESILKIGMINNLLGDLNLKFNSILSEFNETSAMIIKEFDDNKLNFLADIKSCLGFSDLNELSFDILKDVNVKSAVVIDELNLKMKSLLDEISALNDTELYAEKSNEILTEFQTMKTKILDHINTESVDIMKEFNLKSNDILNRILNPQDDLPLSTNEQSFVERLLSFFKGN